MQDENFDSIKELEDAESNQVFSRVDKVVPEKDIIKPVDVSEKDFPQYSEFPTVEEVTSGLTYKAPKPTVERREPTIEENLFQIHQQV